MANKLYSFIFVFNFYKKFFWFLMWFVMCASITILISIYKINWSNELLMVKWSLKYCNVMKRHSLKEKSTYEKVKVSYTWFFFNLTFFASLCFFIFIIFNYLSARWFSFSWRDRCWSCWLCIAIFSIGMGDVHHVDVKFGVGMTNVVFSDIAYPCFFIGYVMTIGQKKVMSRMCASIN